MHSPRPGNGQLLHELKQGLAVAGGDHVAVLGLVLRGKLFAQTWIGYFDEYPVDIHGQQAW